RSALLLAYPSLFFFNATSPTAIYTLSLHDALPIFIPANAKYPLGLVALDNFLFTLDNYYEDLENYINDRVKDRKSHEILWHAVEDRKSTRLNSSHVKISYAVFCLKKKKNIKTYMTE